MVQSNRKIDNNILGPNFFDPKHTRPRLFSNRAYPKLMHLPSFCKLVVERIWYGIHPFVEWIRIDGAVLFDTSWRQVTDWSIRGTWYIHLPFISDFILHFISNTWYIHNFTLHHHMIHPHGTSTPHHLIFHHQLIRLKVIP